MHVGSKLSGYGVCQRWTCKIEIVRNYSALQGCSFPSVWYACYADVEVILPDLQPWKLVFYNLQYFAHYPSSNHNILILHGLTIGEVKAWDAQSVAADPCVICISKVMHLSEMLCCTFVIGVAISSQRMSFFLFKLWCLA